MIQVVEICGMTTDLHSAGHFIMQINYSWRIMNVKNLHLLNGKQLTPVIITQLRNYLLFGKFCSLFNIMVFLSLLNIHDVPAVGFSSLISLVMHLD